MKRNLLRWAGVALICTTQFLLGAWYGHGGLTRHSIKHTGPASLSLRFTEHCYWLLRPNFETFEMCFDNPPPFVAGTKFDDVVYTDDNADTRHFLTARIHQPDGVSW